MSIQLVIFILSAGLFQGLLLMGIFALRRKLTICHVLISVYVLVLLVQMFFKLASKSWLFHFAHLAYLVSYYLPLLYGPLVYLFSLFYINSLKKWDRSCLLHFIPFAMFLLAYAFPCNGHQLPQPILYFFGNAGRLVLCGVSILLYHAAALDVYRKNISNANPSLKIRFRFLKEFSIASF